MLEATFRNLHARLRAHAESVAFFGGGLREGSVVVQHFETMLRHLRRVIDTRRAPSPVKRLELFIDRSYIQFIMTMRCRWAHAVADDFLAKQLPHNVTWGLTMLYSLDHPSNFEDSQAQAVLSLSLC